jgi:putative ABC transport system permease protein
MSQPPASVLQRLAATPGFTVIAVLSLASAIGLNVLIFSFTSPVLAKALPYPAADRLLDVTMAPPDRPEARSPLNAALYALLRDKTGAAFEAIGVYDAGRTANLSGDAGGLAERLAAHRISATGLAALGTTPLHGRLPTAADEQPDAPASVVLGYALWQKRFGGRVDVVGQMVNIDGEPMLVLGVMPEGFGLLDNSSDAFFTSSFEPAPGQEFQRALRGVGRLKPAVSLAEGQAALKVALDEYAATYPERDKGWTVQLRAWEEARLGGMRQPLMWVQLAVGGILLLVCVSLAVLLSARNVAGVRAGVLASSDTRPGVVLAEGLLVTLGGGALAAVFTAAGLPALLELTPGALPRLDAVAFDASTIAFTVALSVAAGLVVGLVPALRASRSYAVGDAAYGWGGRLGATALVVLLAVQATLAFVLVAGAGLGIRAYDDLRARDIGIDVSGLRSFDVHLPRRPYLTPDVGLAGSVQLAEYSAAGPAVFDRVRAALQAAPGVVQAAGVATQPFASAPSVQGFVGDVEPAPVNVQYLAVTENYFKTMGIRLVRGRDFSPADQPESPWVVLVNETMAKAQWPEGDPIGQRLTLTFYPDDGEPAREVIGIVADTLPFRVATEVPSMVYLLHRQQAAQQRASFEGRRMVMSFVARTSGDPVAFDAAVRPLVKGVDPALPVTEVRTVDSLSNAGQTVLLQYGATLLSVFACVVLVACAAGTYSLTALGGVQRRRWMTLAVRALVAAGVGVAVGRAVWLRLADVIGSFLTNLTFSPADPTTLYTAGAVLVGTTLLAFLAAAVGTARTGR